MKILIAVDSSSFSSEVLDSVIERAWLAGTSFRLLTVIEPSTDWDATQQFLRQCQPILEERLNRLKNAMPSCSVVGELLEGAAAETIVDTAKHWPAELIVIGSHGDTGIRRSHIGSVAAAVVNEAPCSVEVVKVRTAPHHAERSINQGRAAVSP